MLACVHAVLEDESAVGEKAYHVHALKAETTGFMVAGWLMLIWGWFGSVSSRREEPRWSKCVDSLFKARLGSVESLKVGC